MWLSFLLKYIDKFDLMKIIGSLIKDNTLSIVYFVTHGLLFSNKISYTIFIIYIVFSLNILYCLPKSHQYKHTCIIYISKLY